MIVRCISDDESSVSARARQYGITQFKGKLEVSIGRCYVVYAMRHDKRTKTDWFFVHTDEMHVNNMWWMPAEIYEIIDAVQPTGWVNDKEWNGSITTAHPKLFEAGIEEGIIDYEDWAVDAYVEQFESDPTSPTNEMLAAANKSYEHDKIMKKYEADLKLARENGYEYPEKPQID